METFPIECKQFWPFSPKLFDNFLFFIIYSFLGMIFNNDLLVSRVGFDYIVRKVIFYVRKVSKDLYTILEVRFGPFAYNYLYYSVVLKYCPILVRHIA